MPDEFWFSVFYRGFFTAKLPNSASSLIQFKFTCSDCDVAPSDHGWFDEDEMKNDNKYNAEKVITQKLSVNGESGVAIFTDVEFESQIYVYVSEIGLLTIGDCEVTGVPLEKEILTVVMVEPHLKEIALEGYRMTCGALITVKEYGNF